MRIIFWDLKGIGISNEKKIVFFLTFTKSGSINYADFFASGFYFKTVLMKNKLLKFWNFEKLTCIEIKVSTKASLIKKRNSKNWKKIN